MTQGILFIHGFTGSTREIQPLVDYLTEHSGDYIYALPTLTGHGVELKLKGARSAHWFRDVENAYRLLAKKVDDIVVVGFSMGGVLALYLALRYKVKKLVLLSPAIKYLDVRQLFKTSKEIVGKRKFLTKNEKIILESNAYQLKHMRIPSVINFTEVVDNVTPYLVNIKQPIMIVQGLKDGLVPSATAQFLYDKVSSKEKTLYFSESGYHQICFSEDRMEWFELVLKFIEQEKEI